MKASQFFFEKVDELETGSGNRLFGFDIISENV